MKKLTRYALFGVYSALILTAGIWIGQSGFLTVVGIGASADTPNNARDEFKPFWEVWQYAHSYYFEQPLDDEALVEGAINGMLATLGDPNTRYFPPLDELRLREQSSGEFQGIGAHIESVDGAITIVSPIEGSPAEAVGLLPGDILRAADGIELTGLDVGAAADLVRGPAGTDVVLMIERDGDLFEQVITRGTIELPSATGRILDNGLAYINLNSFGEQTDEEVEVILTDLLAQSPTGLILDVRSNPGGSLDSVVNIADLFLDEGLVVTQRYGDKREDIHDADTDGDSAETIPMVVLIDGGSASASEVLAGAIRDRDRGILIGQTSFGKGTVQIWFGLSNEGGVRVTNARWLTPDGTWVHETGLEPDIEVALPDPESGEEFSDTQLQEAIDYLLNENN